jgi:hypothetical protein
VPQPQGKSDGRRWSDVGPGWRVGPGPDAFIRRLTDRTSSRSSTWPSHEYTRYRFGPIMVRPIHCTGSEQPVGDPFRYPSPRLTKRQQTPGSTLAGLA